jgi:translation initiation factor 1 (eIF-1/SUI1)
MDVTSIGQKSNLFTEIDKKITIKFLKETKTSRTYIEGLSDFLTNDEILSFSKVLKKKLGAGMVVKEIKNDKDVNNVKFEYGFQGNHTERVKAIMLEETKIPENKIHVTN